ncbi:hypothetical protein IV203_004124 [Nitzschia inconspicua]|uniref:Uncharacterized protein n=1 Tax=Nitzschia inconspicua TaxID=303405 RepID=A0A9K3L532_9STRA|nr:hypothetical protein IV203_004124 [Nitzschia inconspicua]
MASAEISTSNNDGVFKIVEKGGGYFVEILRPDKNKLDGKSDDFTMEAYYISIEPKACNGLIKDLSQCLPLEDGLLHLKRVRKQPLPDQKSERESENSTMSQDPPPKRPKTMLQVLLGTSNSISHRTHSNSDGINGIVESKQTKPKVFSQMLDNILAQHGPLHTAMVPKRPPQSEQEFREFNAIWPTQYYPLKMAEYHKHQMALTVDDVTRMWGHTSAAVREQTVLIVDPQQNKVVAHSKQELLDRTKEFPESPPIETSLTTPVLLAIQGVGRLERKYQLLRQDFPPENDESKTESSKQQHQYLCTGYDMYCYYEPSIFEAMACLHSRLRRLVYCKAPEIKHVAVWRSGCSRHHIHDLPGTNHRYRVFEYHSSCD